MTETTEGLQNPENPDNPETAEETVAAAEVTEAPVEASEPADVAAPAEPYVFERPIQTVGRRKEAVVRVRLVPGTGQFNLNGRTLEGYFPNKVHQQLIKAPLVTVDRVESFDVYAHLHGGGPRGRPARCAWASRGRSSWPRRTTVPR